MSNRIAIVIVGGGAAGINIAQTLDKKLDPLKYSLTLISETDYYRHLPATLRAIVTAEGNLEDQICLPYDKIYGKKTNNGIGRVGTAQLGKVIAIEEKSEDYGYVVLQGNQRIEWNLLVIATGSEWEGPLRWPNRRILLKQYLDNWREKFASAQSVLLVGAGAVGTELAGELREFVPSVQVSIVQKDQQVLNPTYPDSFRQKVRKGLEVRGVRVVTNDTVVKLSQGVLDGTEGVIPGRTVKTTKGVTLPAELIIPTSGSRRVNTHFLGADSPSATTINAALKDFGRLDVQKTLQLTTNPNVFAAGDVVALNEQHTVIKAEAHAPIVAANILSYLKAREFGNEKLSPQAIGLKPYKKAADMIVITNGRTRGFTYIDFMTLFGWPIILGNWFTALVKSKGLLIGMAKERSEIFLTVRLGLVSPHQAPLQARPIKEKHKAVKRLN